MKVKHVLIPSLGVLLAISATRCCRTTIWDNVINQADSANGESTHVEPSRNMSGPTADLGNHMEQPIHVNQRQGTDPALPVVKNGQMSVYFDYDRELEAVDKPWPLSPEMANAETHGAPFKFSFLIVDEDESPVEGAEVAIVALNGQGSEVFPSIADARGIATIEGFGTGEIHVEIDKTGYFHMSMWHWIFVPGFKCVSEGRWLPWNPTVKVRLTKKPETSSAVAYQSEFSFPEGIGMYGFDLLSGTASSSANCDMLISVKYDQSHISGKYPWHSFDITFTGDANGAQIVKKNLFSECPHPSVAPETGYANHLSLDGWKPVADDEALIFKIRGSKEKQPLYGVFRHSFIRSAIGQDFRFDVVVNVEPGVRTLLPASDKQPLARFFPAVQLGSLSEELVRVGREEQCNDGTTRTDE